MGKWLSDSDYSRANIGLFISRLKVIMPMCDFELTPPGGNEDANLHIDVYATLKKDLFIFPNEDYCQGKLWREAGSRVSIQIKGLRPYWAKMYNTLTYEFQQHSDNPECTYGEYFDCKADLFFSGYITEDEKNLIKWVIVDYQKHKNYLDLNYGFTKLLSMTTKLKKTTESRANMIAIKYQDIPSDCILAAFNTRGDGKLIYDKNPIFVI